MRSEEAVQSYDDFSPAVHGGVDWPELAHAVRERLWVVILFLVLAAIGATVYLSGQRQAYQARSVLFIEQDQAHTLEKGKFEEVRPDTIGSLDMINTVVDLLRSYPFAERVAARMKLQKDPRFLPMLPTTTTDPTAAEAGVALRAHMTAEYRPKTRLIDIFVTLPDSSLAMDVANTYTDEYIRYGFEQKGQLNTNARKYLLEESETLSRDLHVAEEAMQSWRTRNNGISLEATQGTAEAKIAELNKNVSDLETRSQQLETDLAVARAHPNDVEALQQLPSVALQPKVVELNGQIADLDRQFTLLKQRYRAKHPLYIATQTQLASLIRDRNQVLQDAVGVLRGGRAQINTQHDELKRQRDDLQSHLLLITGKTVEYNDLKRAVDSAKTLYDSVMTRLASLDVTKDMTESPVRVHERAAGAAPIRVNPARIYAIGVILGLLAGLGAALGLHFMDRSIKTIDQAERIAGVPVLAAVPRKGRKADKSYLDMVSDREGIVAESFRTLRTSLAMTVNVDERRIFMFTSAVPSEGKTFCSSNFAVTMSQQGFKTLLIDGDLRRPMASRVFFGEQRRPGLVDVLAGQATMKDAVLATDIENLTVLTAGNRAPNPAELLSAHKLIEILKEACQTYDRVVIDSAPVLAVSDALLIAPYVDVTCLVLRSFKTPRKTFTRALKALDDIDCRPVGVVFNFLPTGFGSYYYYSGKYHGDYGTKGVYGT